MQSDQIAEFTGHYGPVAIPEKLIQRLWLERSTGIQDLNTTSNLPVKVFHPGKWNPFEGPDFLNAHLLIGDQELRGDIEIHFCEQHWRHHKHHHDPRYQQVILHVVLFPGEPDSPAPGHPPHQLVFLDFLDKDLESLAETDYLEQSIRHAPGTLDPEGWTSLPPARRRAQLISHASVRFYRIIRRLKSLCATEGWEATCHQTALEILGIPGNRKPFCHLARKYPLIQFRQQSLETLWQEVRPHCRTRGVRPTNHPLERLSFYHQLLQKPRLWTDQLREIVLPRFPVHPDEFSVPGGISRFRKTAKLPEFTTALQARTGWYGLGSGKWNTLVVNLILPLLATDDPAQLWPWWFAWKPGNRPDNFNLWMKTWEITQYPDFPHCNGWDQGAIALFTDPQT